MKRVLVKDLKKDGKIIAPVHPGDAGFDVCAVSDVVLRASCRYKMPLGFGIEMPIGYVCIVQGKSGLAANKGLTTIGNVIDASYRGEIHAILFNTSVDDIHIKKGDKVAQLLFHKCYTPEVQFVEELGETTRNASGFGSTGR